MSRYLRAKLGSTGLLITSYLVCLAAPSLTQPVWVLVPVAVAVGGLVRVQGEYFKKCLRASGTSTAGLCFAYGSYSRRDISAQVMF